LRIKNIIQRVQSGMIWISLTTHKFLSQDYNGKSRISTTTTAKSN
jgi:hypothetical protein